MKLHQLRAPVISVEGYICALALLGFAACSGSESGSPPNAGGAGSGGREGTGGTTTTGGLPTTGGATSVTSGTSATGGSSTSATGGSKAIGGGLSTGGIAAAGGAPPAGGGKSTGGTSTTGPSGTGGSLTTGGARPTGGATATGGTLASAGGSKPTGGAMGTGGNKSTGGASAGTGGSKPTGGAPGTGGSTGASACANNAVASCTTVSGAIECHFGGGTGNYLVTVELGGSTAGDMYVEAEMVRRMLGQTSTIAGQTKTYSFTVNVRQPEGQPVQNGANDGISGLDVYIRGNKPLLKSICYQAVTKPPTLWIAGDSTVCDQSPSGTASSPAMDYAGWGQHVPQYFNAPLSVANYADSGESSGSFLGSGAMWGAIKAGWKAGDWVFVQMGHNDKTTSAATFQSNMTAYVTQAKAAGVNIVLITPISRVGYALADEHVNSVGANLPQIIRDIGTAQNVPVIDLTVTTWNWIQTLGSNWGPYFALGTDRTHTDVAGAEAISGFVRDAVKAQNIGVGTNLR